MNDVLPHFALQNEAKRRSFKITFGGVSRQMKCQGLLHNLAALKKFYSAAEGGIYPFTIKLHPLISL